MASEQTPTRGRRRGAVRADKDILIVDDEESLAFFLQQGLLEADPDWQVDTAHTGEEAVVKINRSVYRLIIADLRMPGLNGLELLQMVRALEPTTQVILMTAYGSDEIEAEARRLGVFRYVNKPFRIEDMKAWAQEALATRTVEATVSKTQDADSLPERIEEPPADSPRPTADVTLHQEVTAEQEAVSAEPEVMKEEAAVEAAMAEVVGYLTQMRFRTGAQYIFVASDQGERLAEVGTPAKAPIAEMSEALAAAFDQILALRACFEDAKPPMLLQAAQRHSLFAVLVDSGWMLGMVFTGLIQTRRMEAVWRYVDQAIETLDPILMGPVGPTFNPAPEPAEDVEPELTENSTLGTHPTKDRKTEPLPVAEEAESSLERVLADAEQEKEMASRNGDKAEEKADKNSRDEETFEWNERPADSEEVFSLDEAQSLGLIDDELLAKLRGE